MERVTSTARRRSALTAAFGLVASGAVLLTASPAFAHHPEIAATAACADDGGFVISFTSTAWATDDAQARENSDVLISAIVDGGAPTDITHGAYNAGNNYSFSGQFTLPATTTSLEVTATTLASWGNGTDGGQTTSSGPVSLPTDCEEPPPPPPPPGDDGCTPGYWKNHLDSWQGYAPSASTGSVFSGASAYGLGSQTLLQSLQGSGGSGTTGAARILLRAGTAALLNASHGDVDYTRSAAAVIDAVNAALASSDRAAILALASALDADNNLGCPIS